MKYTYINNNKNKLIIVFSSFMNDKGYSSEQLQAKISFPSLPVDLLEYDFIYIKDTYSRTFGWYAIDNGKEIYLELSAEISEFITNNNYDKEDVIAFGSSKGGFGALLHGLISPNIGTVYTAVPQVDFSTYFHQKNLVNDTRFSDLQNYSEVTNKILYSIVMDSDTKVFFYTGINDFMLEKQIEYIRFLRDFLDEEIEIHLCVGNETHSQLVIDNNKQLLLGLKNCLTHKKLNIPFYSVVNGSEVENISTYKEIYRDLLQNITYTYENKKCSIELPKLLSDYEIAIYFYYKDDDCIKYGYNYKTGTKFQLNEPIKSSNVSVRILLKDQSEIKKFYIEEGVVCNNL